MRHHGRLLQTSHPRLVMVFDKAHELVVGFRMLVFQNLQHASVLRFTQRGVPMHQAPVHFRPLLGIQAATEFHGKLTELAHVCRLGLFTAQASVVQNLFDRQQDLVGVDGLDQVIADFRSNGLLHDVFLLALGDHDDGHVGVPGLDALQGLDPIQTGHVFVQKHHIKRLCFHLIQGFHPTVDACHVVPLLVEKQDVWLQQLNFVVGPKNLWSSHLRLHSSAKPISRRWLDAYLAAALAVYCACRQSNVETRDFVLE